jgi:hypothetical protein
MADDDAVTVVFQLMALHPVFHFLVGNLLVPDCGMHLTLPFEFVRSLTCIHLFGAFREILNPKGNNFQKQIISAKPFCQPSRMAGRNDLIFSGQIYILIAKHYSKGLYDQENTHISGSGIEKEIASGYRYQRKYA